MWTKDNRRLYDRSGLRYPSDLTDEEWALVAPLIPPAKRGGRQRTVDLREVVNGIFYVLMTGCNGGESRQVIIRLADMTHLSYIDAYNVT